ncbi:reverse transcriptase domain-containing protein [Tanacetum coccineum]
MRSLLFIKNQTKPSKEAGKFYFLKGLLRQCPSHGFSELHQLDTFYNSLNSNDQDALDSAAGGNFLDKMPQEGLAIIESKSKVRYSRSRANDSRVSTDAPLSNSSPSNNSFDMQQIAASLEDKMTIKMNKMMNEMKALVVTTPAPIKAVEEVCVSWILLRNQNDCQRVLQLNFKRNKMISGKGCSVSAKLSPPTNFKFKVLLQANTIPNQGTKPRLIFKRFCSHKILLEDDYEPSVQHQRRVNPKIHDVIKKEVEKLLDAGLIYPISDSPWVSPVHCVPKKGGMTVVKNEENELVPTRLVTDESLQSSIIERYFQILIDPKDQEKTTFTCPYGTFAEEHSLFFRENCILVPFKTLKKKLTKAPILIALNWDQPFEIMCDASDYAIGAVLGQRIKKQFLPIHYASKTMTEAESNYTTTEKEMLVVVYAFEKFRSYLSFGKEC